MILNISLLSWSSNHPPLEKETAHRIIWPYSVLMDNRCKFSTNFLDSIFCFSKCQRPDVRVNFLPLDFFPGEEVFENRCLPTPLKPLYWPVASNWGNAPNLYKSPTFRGFLGLFGKTVLLGAFWQTPALPCSVLLHMCSGAEMIEGCSLAKFSVKWHLQATAILLRAKSIGSRPMTCEKKTTNVAWKSGRCLSSNEGSSKSIQVAIRPSKSGHVDTLKQGFKPAGRWQSAKCLNLRRHETAMWAGRRHNCAATAILVCTILHNLGLHSLGLHNLGLHNLSQLHIVN